MCFCFCRKTLLGTRILLVIWTPVLQLWDQGMYGRFSYLWTTARVSDESEMGYYSTNSFKMNLYNSTVVLLSEYWAATNDHFHYRNNPQII